MTKNLVIVESPNKISKIKSFLNEKDWDVISSVGHIRDLKIWGTQLHLGIDLENMKPIYIDIKDKKEVIEEIKKKALKSKNIYIATDPDREGEAIGFHISEIIKQGINENPKNKIHVDLYRASFNEITKPAIEKAIKNSTNLNMKLVESQEARRMLDRMIGFRLSSLSKKKVQAQSAGRVKSVVLKMIIDREEEIKRFKPEYWWTILGEIKKEELLTNVDVDLKEIAYETKNKAEVVLKELTGNFKYIDTKITNRTINPPKPLEMATYLMGMYTNYGMSNSSATMAAQSLYEKGLISYPRTDSTRISSKEFIIKAKKRIISLYGNNYYLGVQEAKAEQDAHEAIRPTDISKSVDLINGIKINEKKAYDFIYKITLKSMMIPGKNQAIREVYQDGKYNFILKKSIIIEPGFRVLDGAVFGKYIKPKETVKLDKKKLEIIENSTKPPSRYNQSSIIKKMKEEGIGRPSTYSATTWGLIQYKYVEKLNGSLVPTELAIEVNDLLIKKANFKDIINVEYTSKMETILDKIAEGNAKKEDFLKKFWKNFEYRVEDAEVTVEIKPPEFIGKKCPKCNHELIKKRGRFGEFVACSNYPECKYTEPLVKKPKPIEIKEDYGLCPKCGAPLIARESKYGTKFIGCSTFPKCNFIMEKEKTAEILLDMGLIDKKSKKKNK